MKYANTQHSHEGIGVEPQLSTMAGNNSIIIVDTKDGYHLVIHDKVQLQKAINLLREASVLCGWGAVR